MMKISSHDLLVPIYTITVLGAFMQIAGGYWDVSWHFLGLVETFFTLPHSVLYTGVVFVLFAAILGLWMRFKLRRNESERHLLTGLHIALVGGGLQVIAGPFDFWWHSTFGFDPFFFTPAHSLLIIGIVLNGVGVSIGSVRLLQAYRSKIGMTKVPASFGWLQALVVVALTTLWLDLNTVIYLITDVDGMAYTAGLCNDLISCANTQFVRQTSLPAFAASIPLLSLTGTLTLFGSKIILGRTGATTLVALLSAGVSSTANLGFRALGHAGRGEPDGLLIASFIPLYLSFLVPVVLFDLLVKDLQRKPVVLLAAALVAPFASFLDGWAALPLWTRVSQLIPILIIPMLIAGLIAGLARVRFANVLLSQRVAVIATAPAK